MKQFLQIHPSDTVAVALQDLPGIPAGHKFALRDIAEGEDIIKYGYPIGHATRDIKKGELVDHHGVRTNLERSLTPDPSPNGEGSIYLQEQTAQINKQELVTTPLAIRRGVGGEAFWGYSRPNGDIGIRNDIWVIPTVGCVNSICRQIVEEAKEDFIVNCQLSILHFPHNYGCSQLGDDHENTRKILRDMVQHPNAGGVLVVGLGCENNQPRDFEAMLGDYDRQRIRFLICQEVEGDEVAAGVAIVKELYEQAQGDTRVPVPISQLRVGLKCGGSDGFSGITANPLLGAFTDWLCKEQGGTAILTEVPEMFGAEHILMSRAVSEDVRQQIQDLIDDFKHYFRSHGQPVGENPSPGNKAGGISTLEEKALGCTQKAGTAPIIGVLNYADKIENSKLKIENSTLHSVPRDDSLAKNPQLSIVNCQFSIQPQHRGGILLLSAPGNDLVASTAMAAAGCHLVLFTTGRGTPFSTFVPTLKVSTNTDLAHRKPQWIDFDAGVLLSGVSMADLLPRFIAYVLDVASGRERTAAEAHGNAEFAIFKTGVTL